MSVADGAGYGAVTDAGVSGTAVPQTSGLAGVFDGGYRFDTFVVGASNRLAVSAAMAVADSPGAAYNPLLVYGGSGLGKTHLVAAIVHRALGVRPALRVEFSTGEDLVERLSKAIGIGQQERFTREFGLVDLLILDDVQFLVGQRETQSELLRLFNLMQGDGRQLVMTSDRAPADIPDVDSRLLSRLSGGLLVDVGTPDYEMRLAILRNACAARALTVEDGVLREVARIAFGNVRELKGALNRVAAYQQLDGQGISPADVRAVLGERSRAPEVLLNRASEHDVPGAAEYEGFLADVAFEVETRVESWRLMLGEACTIWRAEGFATGVLERAMTYPVQPDVNGLLATFTAAVDHLRFIEAQAVTVDPVLRGHAAFRNPEAVAVAESLLAQAMSRAVPLPGPLPSLTRETLVTGPSNLLVHKAFDAIVAHPGVRYNPLFVHGPTGVGKTHVAHALGNALRTAFPSMAIACVGAAHFAEELVAAMQSGGVERWRARYRAADVLVLDDVQLLAEAERTQEEFFHLFNHLHERGSQIVLTGDGPPRELHGLADRLRSRFEGGLVVALNAPDRALRQSLVQSWLQAAGAEPSQELVALLADLEVTSVRELRGQFMRVQASADLNGFPVSLDSAQHVLGVVPARVNRSGTVRLMRSAGDAGATDNYFLDREKIVWDWPELGGRVIEEVR